MSLLLDALKRVEAKRSVATARPWGAPSADRWPTISRHGPAKSVSASLDSIVKASDVPQIDGVHDSATILPPRRASAGTTVLKIDPSASLGGNHPSRRLHELAARLLDSFSSRLPLVLAVVSVPASPEASELLSGLSLAVGEQAGGVVIESDGSPDQLPLLGRADGVYLMATLGKTPRTALEACAARLRAARVLIRGGLVIT